MTVRAAVITRYGHAPVLVDREPPEPSDGFAVVTTTAAPITPLDVLCATGTSYFGQPPLPYVPGVQGVGIVEAADNLPAGTVVWYPTSAGMAAGDGSMAQQVLVPEADLLTLKGDVPDTLVAALGLSAIAAWMSLTWRARFEPGEQVMVLGAGGVVGQVATQAAKLLGARRVVAACRSDTAQERARTAGADAVVVLRDDDTADELAARMAAACDGPVDVVIDPLCGVPASAALRVLAPDGRLVNLGSSAGETATFASAGLRSKAAAILGYTNNAVTTELKARALADLLAHAASGRLTVSHQCVTLDDLPAAWTRQASGQAESRLVVTLV